MRCAGSEDAKTRRRLRVAKEAAKGKESDF